MELKNVFGLIGHLTSQTSTKDLTEALGEILQANFPGVQVIVYEIQGGRIGESGRNCIVGIDTLQLKAPMYLHQHESVYEAFQSKKELNSHNSAGQPQLILPVELYDRTVSHMIVCSHPYKAGAALDLFKGLIRIFSDVFRNLHEKGYDPLTRILNRQAFDQTITKLAYSPNKDEKFHRFSKGFGTVAILDVDNFKSINDQYGHAIGDETLVLFAQTIRSVLRQEDLFFRYGGEEFVIFIKETNAEHAKSILDRCRKSIEEKRFPQVEHVTVSIGFARLKPLNEHPSDSLSKADKSLYYAKQNGRNKVCSYDTLLKEGIIQPVSTQHGSADFWE